MKLKDAEIGKDYEVTDIQFCDDCGLENDTCVILSIMDRGLVPGCRLRIISKKLGMYELMIDDTHLIIRESLAFKFNIFLK